MASSDALPIPRKNSAYRVTFPLKDAVGDPVASATSLDSEVSKDAGAFADCTSEATAIAQGMYSLDLTAAEMNADTVAIIIKSGNAKQQDIVLYPEETGDIRVNVTQMTAGVIAAATFAANALDAVWSTAARLLTAGTNIALAKGTGVTGFNDLSAADVNAQVLDVLVTDTFAEPAAVPAATSSLKDKLGWLFVLARNKRTQTATTQTLRNDADNASIATSTTADDGTTFSATEWV